MNHERLMWANDFPHSDATWPNSQAMLAEHAAHRDKGLPRIVHEMSPTSTASASKGCGAPAVGPIRAGRTPESVTGI